MLETITDSKRKGPGYYVINDRISKYSYEPWFEKHKLKQLPACFSMDDTGGAEIHISAAGEEYWKKIRF